MIHYEIDNINLQITYYNSTNNITIDYISKEFCDVLGYTSKEIVGAKFYKIIDYSIISTIEDAIEFNDGIINLVDVLNKISDFYFLDINKNSIMAKIKSYNFVSTNNNENVVYVKIGSLNISAIWRSFMLNFININTNVGRSKLSIMCNFIGIYNIDSIIVTFECSKLSLNLNKESIIQCISNDFYSISNFLYSFSYIGADCFIAIFCGIQENKISYLIDKIYNRVNCIMLNNNFNTSISIKHGLLLKYGRYALSRVNNIEDVVRVAEDTAII